MHIEHYSRNFALFHVRTVLVAIIAILSTTELIMIVGIKPVEGMGWPAGLTAYI